MRQQPDINSRKKIAYATAAAVASFAPSVASEAPPIPNANACTQPPPSGVHETLWGNPEVWNEEAYTMDPSSILNISRGGTDESPPRKNSSDKKDDSKHKNKKKRSNNKKKKAKDKEVSPEESENESDSVSRPATNPMMEEILQSNDYYDILGLSQGEDDTSKIKKAYRRRAVQTHPDKTGGDRRAFDKLAEAYEVLLDDDKRALYDRYGKEGLDPTRGPPRGMGSSAEDLFRSFFGGQPPQRGPVNRSVQYQLQVTLEELYKGCTKTVTVEAPRGNDFYSQFQQASKKKQVEVIIPKGAHPGQSVVLSGEMDFDSQDGPPGDLIFQLLVRKHKDFTRKGHDLAREETISLQEAICGFTRRFRHLNGKYITVESAKHPLAPTTLSDLEPDEEGNSADETDEKVDSLIPSDSASANIYIHTGDVQVLRGQGMPKNPQGTEFGDLYVQFTVELPKTAATNNLTHEERIELARLLEKLEGKPHRSPAQIALNKGKSQSFVLEPARASDFGRASGPIPNVEEEHSPLGEEHHHNQQQFPFAGMGHRQFFFSSSGRSPFFGQENNFEDDENVQCRQM